MNGTTKMFLAAMALSGFVACSSDQGTPSGSGGDATGHQDASHTGGTTAGGTGGAPATHDDAGADQLAETGGGAGGTSEADARNDDAQPDVDRTADGAGTSTSDAANAADVAVTDGSLADGSSGDELIHYYGRWNRLSDRAITVNTGSHVEAEFSGTAISARFDVALNQTPNPTLTWRIDQGAWQEGELAASVSVGTGLSTGTHEVTVMVRGLNENQNRWSPPLVSSITFLGFDVTGGALRASARPLRPRIEFLGDSITEGINVDDGPQRPDHAVLAERRPHRLSLADGAAFGSRMAASRLWSAGLAHRGKWRRAGGQRFIQLHLP